MLNHKNQNDVKTNEITGQIYPPSLNLKTHYGFSLLLL